MTMMKNRMALAVTAGVWGAARAGLQALGKR
jgi:hypothetical protein